MENSRKIKRNFKRYLEFIQNRWTRDFYYNPVYQRIAVKFDFENNKIKFAYYPRRKQNLYNNLLRKGWVVLKSIYIGRNKDYHVFSWDDTIDNIAFCMTEDFEWVFTGLDPLLNPSTIITKIEPGTTRNLQKGIIKTGYSDWKITVENLGKLEELKTYIENINKSNKNSSIFGNKKKLKADYSETIIKDYKKLKF